MPATIEGLVPGPRGAPMGGVWGVVDLEDAPTLNLLSATPTTDTTLVLTFDRPPSKGTKEPTDPTAYTITSLGVGVAMTVSSAALGSATAGEYPTTVILTVTEGTNGESYRVTVAGLDGACGETLSTATADWTATGTGPSVTYATGLGASVTVHFNEPVSAVPGGWTVVPLGGGVPVAVNVVTMPDASTYLLTLNTSMTSQASYRVTAPGSITDLATNAIVGTTADFTAFEEVTRTYTAVSPAGAPTDAYACDLTGAPLDGYGPLDLYPASPVVTLARLVLTSLLSDREALASDRIPDGTTDRRGWWADSYNDDKRKTGSRLWLLASSPIRDDTAKQAKSYAEEALAWMVKDGIAAAVTVEAELQGSSQERRVAVGVTVTKDDGTGVRLQFPELWTIYGG